MARIVKFKILNSKFIVWAVLILCFSASNFVLAAEYTSTDFQVQDPILEPGGYSSSDSYQLLGAISQIAIGTSTATNFNLAAGFFFYPTTTPPTGLSATAGDGQVSLSWTAGSAVLGWSIGGYNVGRATASGGPYTFTSVGNVTSKTMTGLTNGTTYYFVVRNEDAFGNSIATSTEVSSAPQAAAQQQQQQQQQQGGGGGGGGGGAAPYIPLQAGATNLIFKGRAYPSATVTILKDGSVLKTPSADSSGNFLAEASVGGGIYTFSLYAIDSQNRKSITTSFTLSITADKTTTISDIVIAPTIGADKSQVKLGNDIQFFGYAYPQSQINVIINSEHEIYATSSTDRLGAWLYQINSEELEIGGHTVKSQAVTPGDTLSPFSESLAFKVGDSDIAFGLALVRRAAVPPAYNKNGDINNDKRVNIVDFSIMLYFWNQRNPSNPYADINGDGIVNLFDFSIMLFWWTG